MLLSTDSGSCVVHSPLLTTAYFTKPIVRFTERFVKICTMGRGGGRALDEGLDGSEVGAAADQGAAQELRRVLVNLPQLDHPAAR